MGVFVVSITARAKYLAACGEDEGANPVIERAEMVEAREPLQVTKHHFNTAPLWPAELALRCGCFIFRWSEYE